MSKKKNKTLKIILRAYTFNAIDRAVSLISEAVSSSGVKVCVVNLPKKKKRLVVNRSPHVYSSSKEEFQIITYKTLILIAIENDTVVSQLSKIKVDSGVDVRIEVVER